MTGPVRSKEKGDALADAGATPVSGAASDLDVLRGAAADADGVIHSAFGLDFYTIVDIDRPDYSG